MRRDGGGADRVRLRLTRARARRPGAPYGKFAGRDATRAFALTSLDDECVENSSIDDIADLSTLNDWIASFESKYDNIGWLVDDISEVEQWEAEQAELAKAKQDAAASSSDADTESKRQ